MLETEQSTLSTLQVRRPAHPTAEGRGVAPTAGGLSARAAEGTSHEGQVCDGVCGVGVHLMLVCQLQYPTNIYNVLSPKYNIS